MAQAVSTWYGELNTMMNCIIYAKSSIVKVIKIAILKWLGHTARMRDNAS
jgi:hypothetical protein